MLSRLYVRNYALIEEQELFLSQDSQYSPEKRARENPSCWGHSNWYWAKEQILSLARTNRRSV